MTRTLIFICDSHMAALNRANQHLRQRGETEFNLRDVHFIMPDVGNISRQFMMDLADGSRVLNPALVKEFDRPWSPPGRVTPSVLNRWTRRSPLAGTDHQVFMLWGFAEMHSFAFEGDWAKFGIEGEERIEAAPGDRYLLPRELVREQLMQLVKPVLDVVNYLAERGIHVDTLAGPPPEKSNEFIRSKRPALSPAAPATRLVIYETLIDIYRAHARDHGYRFREAPSSVRDDVGFLKAGYTEDGVHGSGAYGAEVLKNLLPDYVDAPFARDVAPS